ncbi:hypothetical protein JOS77_09115 [Chromobacterium haemolyticum]|nr:hypothetical protein JOS77_09115 [Chromobacterium haemolyticum]
MTTTSTPSCCVFQMLDQRRAAGELSSHVQVGFIGQATGQAVQHHQVIIQQRDLYRLAPQ